MLPNYTDILVATDLSLNSVHAFKHAVMMARRNDARIHLLHVVPEIDASMRSYISALMLKGSLEHFAAQHEEDAWREIRKNVKKFAEEELANFPEDLERLVTIEVVHGHPVAKILETADQVKADVIVMGSHGKGSVGARFPRQCCGESHAQEQEAGFPDTHPLMEAWAKAIAYRPRFPLAAFFRPCAGSAGCLRNGRSYGIHPDC